MIKFEELDQAAERLGLSADKVNRDIQKLKIELLMASEDIIFFQEDTVSDYPDYKSGTLQKVYRTMLSFDKSVVTIVDSEDVTPSPQNWTIAC